MNRKQILRQWILAATVALLLGGCAGTLDTMRGVYAAQLGDNDYINGDYADAMVNLQKAADLNNSYACYRLYVMHQYGQGTEKSPDKATHMLEKAAQLGDETSQVILGSRLLFGKKSERAKGVRLLEAAAGKENRYAYEYLALAYQQGLGVDRNADRAREYERLAKSQGSTLSRAAGSGSKSSTKASSSSQAIETTKAIQAELKRLGYYRGKVDGLTGPMTRDAISRFQKDHGIPVNPEISAEVLRKLREQ